MNKQSIKGKLPNKDLALQINCHLAMHTPMDPNNSRCDLVHEAQGPAGVTDGKQKPQRTQHCFVFH